MAKDTTSETSVFDSRGQLQRISKEAVAKLTPERQERYKALREAADANTAAEAELKAAEFALHGDADHPGAIHVESAARQALARLQPAKTFFAALE
jgi:hypothetical protein